MSAVNKYTVADRFRRMSFFNAPFHLSTIVLCVFSLLLTACHSSDGGGSGPAPGNGDPVTYSIGGSVSGLGGAGLILRNNGANDLALDAGATSFQFPTAISAGSGYNVSVLQQPAGQMCTVGNGAGTQITANVGNVSVVCSDITHTVGGTLAGLTTTGLVLRNNGGDDLALDPGDTTFQFATPIAHDGAYNVTVQAQPVGLVCTVGNGSGSHVAADVGNVAVVCSAATFSISVGITGLTTSGLVLRNNGTDDLSVPSGATGFQFATQIAYGGAYNVTVQAQPTGQTCTVSTASGSNITSSVTNVDIICSTNNYSIGGTITGLSDNGLVLRNNGTDDLAIVSGATTFQFAAPIAYSSSYNVTVMAQPVTQTCAVSNGSGSGVIADVSDVVISCVNNTHTVGGSISGLVGSLTLQNNGGDDLTHNANGTFTFATPVFQGGTYNVTVLTQPAGQTCTISNGAGTISSSNVTNIIASCYSPIPTINSVSPNTGSDLGGTSVIITGTYLTTVATVYFGPNMASFTVINDTTLVATAPAGTVGPVDVSVLTDGGSTTLTNAYTYVP